MNRWIPIYATAASLACAVGCSKREPDTTTTTTTPAVDNARATTLPSAEGQAASAPAANMAASAPTPLTPDDKDFVTKAAQGGMLEVALGQAAAKNASSPDVKAFGNRMVTDHGTSGNELKQIAARKGAAIPTELDAAHKSTLEKISKLSGSKLDKEYADDMVEDHEEDIKEFREASKNLNDPELRDWATKTLPILEHHLSMAKEIKAKTKNER